MPAAPVASPRTARRDEARALANALAAAFADDPVFGWLLPPGGRDDRLRRFFALELEALVLPRGAAWTADELAGAALYLPADAWRMPPSAMARHGRTFARVFGRRLGHAAGLLAVMESRHLRRRHVYLPYIGVAPAEQGRGLGSRLMRPILDAADAAGLPAYLEATSERNVALYERLGFRATGRIGFLGSPPLTPMVREPYAG